MKKVVRERIAWMSLFEPERKRTVMTKRCTTTALLVLGIVLFSHGLAEVRTAWRSNGSSLATRDRRRKDPQLD